MTNPKHLLALLPLLALACGRGKTEERPAPPEPVVKASAMAAAAEVPPPPPPALPAFRWTETPRLDDVPEGPIRGELDGRPFEAKWIGIQPDTDRSWRINVADKEPSGGPLGLLFGARYAGIYLAEPPTAGKRYERAMAPDKKGFLHMKDAPRDAGLGDWHGECAWAVEITAWDVRDWDPAGQMGQLAGTASGRLALTCRGRDDVKDSWLAGAFENATVRYMGVPWWVPKDLQRKILGDRRIKPKL